MLERREGIKREVVMWRLTVIFLLLGLPSQVFINFAEGKMDADTEEVTESSDVDSLDSYNVMNT